MANANKDNNGIPIALGTLDSDGVTLVKIKVNPVNNAIMVDDNTTGTNLASAPVKRDDNRITGLMGVSSVDGITPIPIAVDADGSLLIDSN